MALHRTKALAKKLPAAKPHLDLLAAILTIPVLITVIILNFGNLTKGNKTPTPTPDIQTRTIIEKVPVTSAASTTNSPGCTPGIGNLAINTPQEGDSVSTNPTCITISYQSNNHCAVVWSYRINNGNWSDYSNNAVCLYNMPAGPITFDLQAKSLVNSDSVTLERHFVYAPTLTPTPTQATPAPTATPTPNS
jgi:hypothetical protein